jgi:hypothetical protein
VAKVRASNEEQEKRTFNSDHAAAALQDVSLKEQDSGSNHKAKKKKKSRNLPGSKSSSTTSGKSNTSSIADDGSAPPSVSQEGSLGGLNNPDFAGNTASSRAHYIPNSECCFSHGVFCQAVCGVELTDKESLRRLADLMMKSDTNLLRAPGVHGELFDQIPCWILVPICSWEFMKNWSHRQGYTVMAIAGGFDAVSDAAAYKGMCKNDYDTDDEDTTGTPKLSKCGKKDIATATASLSDMVLALAETLVGRTGKISPVDLQYPRTRASLPTGPNGRKEVLVRAQEAMERTGIVLPQVQGKLEYNSAQVLKCVIDPMAHDLVPDPMLLLMKAAINWSWRCKQKPYPACGSAHGAVGEEEELVVPSTPIPSFIEVKAVPVTPETDDDDDDLSL